MRAVNAAARPAVTLLCLLVGSCYGGQPPTSQPQGAAAAPPPALGKRARGVPDDCAPQPGQPEPEPLRTEYTGLAKAARCQREVYSIMGGIRHFLGVECRHCHVEPDYQADTHNKQIANWMARELIPQLRLRDPQPNRPVAGVWCQDCHAGKAKFLGDPRRRDFAVEWMTTHMTEDFDTPSGKPPRCRQCHGGDLGAPDFRSKIILSELPEPPAPPAPPAPPPDAPAAVK